MSSDNPRRLEINWRVQCHVYSSCYFTNFSFWETIDYSMFTTLFMYRGISTHSKTSFTTPWWFRSLLKAKVCIQPSRQNSITVHHERKYCTMRSSTYSWRQFEGTKAPCCPVFTPSMLKPTEKVAQPKSLDPLIQFTCFLFLIGELISWALTIFFPPMWSPRATFGEYLASG